MNQSNVIVNHIANFPSQRDKELLALSLLKSIKSMMHTNRCSIVTLDNSGSLLSKITYDDGVCVVEESKQALNKKLFTLLQQLSASEIEEYHYMHEGEVTFIRLLTHTRTANQFVLMDLKEKMNKEQTYILSGILSIYNNYSALINESQTDPLTGLCNRKTFDAAIAKVFDGLFIKGQQIENDRRHATSDKPVKNWLAMLDLDHFKSINDTYGHLYGDEILIQFGQLIRGFFRAQDFQFRFGGEEFAVLFQAPDLETGRKLLENFKDKVAAHSFPNDNKVTVSIGAVELTKDVFAITQVDYADQALYHSKKTGRNRVTFFEDILESGEAETQDFDGSGIDFF